MNEMQIVIGRQYRLQITEDTKSALTNYGLGNVVKHAQDFHNVIVTVRKTSGGRVYIKECISSGIYNSSSQIWYWPIQCFKQLEVELVLGDIYIVNEIPTTNDSGCGWVSDMDSWCKKRLICKALKKSGDGEIYAARMVLETTPHGIGWTFLKSWVRSVTTPKPSKTIKRNVLNFWPGT